METMLDFDKARANMVESQIRTNKVTDERLVAAMRAIPREIFVPPALQGVAYVDEDLNVGGGRYMTEPMVLARLLQSAEVGPEDAVLVIGSTTGYAVALLAQLAETVVGIEDDAELVNAADKNLAALGIDNAAVIRLSLAEGYAKQAPYDVILIEGRCGVVPEVITRQLAPGGRLVTVTDERGVGKATLLRRSGDTVSGRVLFDAQVPALGCFARKSEFVF
jgi:protein-L-isoaspartate(D-aspartate) O-methyltransferase